MGYVAKQENTYREAGAAKCASDNFGGKMTMVSECPDKLWL